MDGGTGKAGLYGLYQGRTEQGVIIGNQYGCHGSDLSMLRTKSPKKDGKYGPYRQSERKSIYLKHINYLLDKGSAYYAFDSAEALNNERKNHEEKGKTFIYNWHNRTKGRLINSLVLSKDEVDKKISSGDD